LNWELIIVDDSTTNDVETLVNRFASHDKNIRYIKNEVRKGLPASRNIGISLSAHPLVLFIEDDLILDTDALDRLVTCFNEQLQSSERIAAVAPSRPWVGGTCSSPAQNLLTKNQDTGSSPCFQSKFTGLIYHNFSPEFGVLQEVQDVHPCSLYLKQALIEVGLYDETSYVGNFFYEDSDLNHRIRRRGYKFYFAPDAIFYHIITSEGGCRTTRLRYGLFFVKNHITYVRRNFGARCVYMIPLFFVSFTKLGLKQIITSKTLRFK
jgi:GT2 family glycosyltransferase